MKRLIVLGIAAVSFVVVTSPLQNGEGDEAPVDAGGEIIPASPDDVYDPVRAGEEPPDGFRQLLYRDRIRPIYNPTFTDAASVDWPDASLVVAVAGEREAKAYPVTHLNRHEMVIDEIEGDPILVSW